MKCDSTKPSCNNCMKAHRSCKGYGIQLSWPRSKDKRRSIIGYHLVKHSQPRAREFLNVSSWDVWLSDRLEHGYGIGTYLWAKYLGQQLTEVPDKRIYTLKISSSISLSPFPLGVHESLLLEFCIFHLLICLPSGWNCFWLQYLLVNDSKSRLLAPILDEALVEFILRIALSDSSSLSNTVLQAILALSSLQLHGHSKSVIHEGRVISLLQKSILQLDRQTIIQNLTATMLLYQYQVTDINIQQFICLMTLIRNSCRLSRDHQDNGAFSYVVPRELSKLPPQQASCTKMTV